MELETHILKKLLYIALYTVSVFLMLSLLSMAPAGYNNAADKKGNTAMALDRHNPKDSLSNIAISIGKISELSVDSVNQDSYSWELYNDSTLNFAKANGATNSTAFAEFVGGNLGHKVKVKWKEPGLYIYKVTAYNVTGCSSNMKLGIVRVVAEKNEKRN